MAEQISDARNHSLQLKVNTDGSINSKDYWMEHAIQIIEDTYGDKVTLDAKKKDLFKFGRSVQVQTTKTTLMDLPTGTFNETYVSSNAITHFASNSSSDTSKDMTVEGHTVDGSGNFTFVIQTVTLAGTAKTALTTPLARVSRAYNAGSSDFVGIIYIAEDVTFNAGVPQTDSAVHLIITAGENQSDKCSTTISNLDYWVITQAYADMLSKVTAYADVTLEIRQKGKVFRKVCTFSCTDGARGVVQFTPYIIVPKNSDVRLRARADTNGRDVSGGIQGALLTS